MNQDLINILLVDDRQENLIALEALISRNDVNIISTQSPNEALRLAWQHDISIALVDVQMPEMDGFELVHLLKNNAKTKDILVIFVTAISKESKYAVKGFGTGAIDYIFKPLDPYITAAKVDSFIQLSRSRREIARKNRELGNYELMVNNSADIICTVDIAQFRILRINRAIDKMLGFLPEEVLNKSILNLTTPDSLQDLQSVLQSMVEQKKETASVEIELKTIKHQSIWTECRISLVEEILLLNISDISARKKFTNELIQSKEVAEHNRRIKENFLANMSHEIRTPINGIMSLAHVLQNTDINAEQSHIVDLIQLSSQSLLGIVNDILDLSKIESGKFTITRSETNIRQITRSITELMKFKAEEKGISFSLVIDDKVPYLILADALRINQILLNLVSNAIKFTEKGYVKISLHSAESKADKTLLKFVVEDTGIGIPSGKLETIFESFSQAENTIAQRFGGTGLGLTIVQKLVELKGGNLTVSSQLGKGSVFTFSGWYTVLEEASPIAIDHIMPKAIQPTDKKIRVLLAEDNHINQFTASQILKRWNIITDIAENGEVAVKKLTEEDYDIVLMDTHMPVMNGYEAARRIRVLADEYKRNTPIISLSAAVLENERQDAIEAGMNEVVSKPFKPEELIEAIYRLVGVTNT